MRTERVWLDHFNLLFWKNGVTIEIYFCRVADNSIILYSDKLNDAFSIHHLNELLRSLNSGHQVCFSNYSQYGTLIKEIEKSVRARKEFDLTYCDADYTRHKHEWQINCVTDTPPARLFFRRLRKKCLA